MTREEFAELIHWPKIIWLIGIANPFFMFPQLLTILTSGLTEEISVTTLVVLIGIQAGFAIHGFFLRNNLLMLSNSAAATVTLITVISVLYFRS